MNLKTIVNSNKELIFAAVGFVTGVVTGMALTKAKYESIAEEQIESMARVYKSREKKKDTKEETDEVLEEAEESIEKLKKTAEETKEKEQVMKLKNEYMEKVDQYDPEPMLLDGDELDPIPPEEFDTIDDYSCVSYDYLEGSLKDETGVECEINDKLKKFLDGSDLSTLYFRDPVRKIDYEVLKEV